jgi:Zn-dependent alcohol dehydrogenase
MHCPLVSLCLSLKQPCCGAPTGLGTVVSMPKFQPCDPVAIRGAGGGGMNVLWARYAACLSLLGISRREREDFQGNSVHPVSSATHMTSRLPVISRI